MKKRPSEEAAYHYIKEKITTRYWLPDAHIREQDVADALNMSRTPVRKAFAQLEKEGWVVKEPYRGIRIQRPKLSEKDFQHRMEFLELMINHYLHKLQLEEVEFDTAELEELISELEKLVNGDHQAFLEREMEFWRILFQHSKNDYNEGMIFTTLQSVYSQEGTLKQVIAKSRGEKVSRFQRLTNYVREQNYPYARREIRILINQLQLNVIQGVG